MPAGGVLDIHPALFIFLWVTVFLAGCMMLFFNLPNVLLSLHTNHRFRGTTSLDLPGSSFFLHAVFLGREECLLFKGLSNPA